jgi:hypothetical protein
MEAAQLLQTIIKEAAMRRDWETRLAEEQEYNARMKKRAEFSKEATPEITKEEPIPKNLEEEQIKSRTTPSVDIAAVGEFRKTCHPRNVEVNEICDVSFQEQRTRDDLESETHEVSESRTHEDLESETHEVTKSRTREDRESETHEASESRTREDQESETHEVSES